MKQPGPNEFEGKSVTRWVKGQPSRSAKRQMSILQALEWAFATEQVSIEFDEFDEPAGSDTIWRLMRQCPYIRAGLQRAGFSGGWLRRAPAYGGTDAG